MSENPLTSRWRENLHNRSGYVPKRGATWSVVSLFPSPSPQTVLHVHEKKAIRFLCMPFAAILNLLSFNLSPFSLHIFLSYVYIYIFSAPIQCFFSFFLFPHLSPPLPFFSVFLMLVHRSNHLFTYSFIYPPDLRIFIRSRTLGNSLGNSVTITVSDLLLFPQFVAWILLVEYSRFTRVFCKFIYKRFLNM